MIQTDSQSSAAGILHQFLQLHVIQLNVLHYTCTITANIIHILHGFQGDIPEYFAIIVTHEKKTGSENKKSTRSFNNILWIVMWSFPYKGAIGL